MVMGETNGLADVGSAVRRVRTAHGWTQTEAAHALGVSQRYLSEIERGLPKVFDEQYVRTLRGMGVRLLWEIDDDLVNPS